MRNAFTLVMVVMIAAGWDIPPYLHAAPAVISGNVSLPAGVFEITAPIYLSDDTTIEGAPWPGRTVIRKGGRPFGHVFANTAATNYGATTNFNLTLRNLIIDVNSNEVAVSESSPMTRGLFQFAYVSNVICENITFTNAYLIQYGFHLQSVQEGHFTNITYMGGKTLAQMQAECAFISFDGWTCKGGDDVFALNAADWAGDAHRVGGIHDIVLRNGTVLPYSDATKNLVRFLPGSWADWCEGNSYKIADYCVSGGRIYQMVNRSTNTATIAPSHTFGSVKGADGIVWQWLEEGTHHVASIRDVLMENVLVQDARQVGISIVEGPDMRPEYPGTEGSSEVANVTIRNIRFDSTFTNVPALNISGGHSSDIVLENIQRASGYFCLRVVGGHHELITLRNVPLYLSDAFRPIICQLTDIDSLVLDGVRVNSGPALASPLNDYLMTDGSVRQVQVLERLKAER